MIPKGVTIHDIPPKRMNPVLKVLLALGMTLLTFGVLAAIAWIMHWIGSTYGGSILFAILFFGGAFYFVFYMCYQLLE